MLCCHCHFGCYHFVIVIFVVAIFVVDKVWEFKEVLRCDSRCHFVPLPIVSSVYQPAPNCCDNFITDSQLKQYNGNVPRFKQQPYIILECETTACLKLWNYIAPLSCFDNFPPQKKMDHVKRSQKEMQSTLIRRELYTKACIKWIMCPVQSSQLETCTKWYCFDKFWI